MRKTHGESGYRGKKATKEWKAWSSVKERVLNPNCPNYKNYGARGIKIYSEWISSYEEFLSYIGRAPSRNHSLDRIDNDGDYTPGNIRWATKIQQHNNERRNRKITFKQETMTMTQWSRKLGIGKTTLFMRINKYKWPIKKAFSLKIHESQIGNDYWKLRKKRS